MVEKATPGPWHDRPGRDFSRIENEDPDVPVALVGKSAHDAEFIAAARTAVPALVAAVRSRDERITELIEQLRAAEAESAARLEAYETWKRVGTEAVNVVDAIWHAVTPYDTQHMTTSSQPDAARLAVIEVLTELAAVKQQRADNLKAIAERDAVIAATPHDIHCGGYRGGHVLHQAKDCDCWKSTAPASVLAARDAEVSAYALEEADQIIRGIGLVGTNEEWAHWLDSRAELRYRAGADQ